MEALLALAFGAGMLAPVNPCGFAVLPALLAHAVGTDTTDGAAASRSTAARLGGGLRAGAALTLGFAGTFTVIGILLAVGMRSLIGVVPWAAAVLGGVLAVAGLAMVAGRRIPLRLPSRRSGTPRQGPRGMIAFGAGYALASASCTLAVLLSVVTQALATTNFSGILVMFGAYAAGSATLLLFLAVFAAFASGLINRFLRRLLPHMHRITGTVLALSGGYLLLYWLPQLTGSGGPGSNALAGPVSGLAVWINTHQLLIVAIALTLIAAIALTAYAQRSRTSATGGREDPLEDCCAPTTAAEAEVTQSREDRGT
ncbi:Cytochrome c biogenesis protein CcdA [Amycolatopsis marina]|uniref:Cytochrome c biogenesis protein CcdA n=1 Tax=Amycolatopsis marina TaxID=490629 RepID=A0A1I1CL54_9PSEU|nr:cytochrome c biogenesis protein CcdA [Amycolatopsis marina]SFB62782.1 Cytochrome c biogenesis protein CcdA [Amycolatopsis marina]